MTPLSSGIIKKTPENVETSDGTKSDFQPIPILDLRFIPVPIPILIYLGSQIPKLRLEVEILFFK